MNLSIRQLVPVTLGLLSLPCLAVLTRAANPERPSGKLEYNRDIRPILAENCFACHGPDSAARKGKLRLDIRDEAVKAGVITPGQPEKSGLVERIFAASTEERMPPLRSRKTLTPAQKDLLKRWIVEGAEYQAHWAYIAPQRPTPPKPGPLGAGLGWVRNPIDHFILAEMEKHGLKPAPEADRRTLARRLSLDLTGLPPTPEGVEKFVTDPRQDAYEHYVDELLKSPHWGEHRGRIWLDAARYADTHGIHFDNFREMWTYRDWVIGAFNRNLPFDQFTIEQLAGDMLPNKTLDQTIASGFNRCNITTNEGGVIAEEYLVLYTRDRIETVSQVWLGTTAGCAVCHDHKFDPLSQREFYEMAAFFNNTTQGAMDGNIKDTPPILNVPRAEDRERMDVLAKETADHKQALENRKNAARPEFDQWVKTASVEQIAMQIPTQGLKLHARLGEGEGKTVQVAVNDKTRSIALDAGVEWSTGKVSPKAFVIRPGKSIEVKEAGDFEKDQSFSCSMWVNIPKRGQTGALVARMDNGNAYRGWDVWLETDRVGMHIINKWQEDALKIVSKTPLKPGEWHHVVVTYDGSAKAAGVRVYLNGEPQAHDVQADALKSTIKTNVPFKVGQRNTSERLQGVAVQDLRVYDRLLSPAEVAQLQKATRGAELLAKPADKRTPEEQKELYEWWLMTFDTIFKDLTTRIAAVQEEKRAIRTRGTIAHVAQEKTEMPMAYILYRGDYDKRRDQVKPGTPKFLPLMPAELPRNRLGYAQWLLRPEHPLTARVTVNRFWQDLFGTGIVKTSGDFGVAGELPTHPELLDWLAVEFRESGWDVKKFFKLLVTSATYRQAAVTTPEKLAKDPQNRYVSRGSRYRLDAETVRDYALASSGLLVRKLGGPSVKPYQPEGVWEAVAMIGSNTRDYKRDSGDNLYRRSMYTFWKRAAPPASMEIFNAPNRETCAVRRERTNTPLQALVTLNDPQFVEAARVLAEKALKDGGEKEEGRIDFIAKRLLARSFKPEEASLVRESLKELLAYYQSQPEDAKKLIAVGESKADAKLDPAALAGWTMLVNQLMNLDEVLNK